MSRHPGLRAVHVAVAAVPRGVTTDWLDDPERYRAAGFADPDDRDRFVAARSLLRAILAAHLDVDPRRVPLRQRPAEAPELLGPDLGLRWSVSHAGPIVVVALARRPVGVDVESATAGRDWTRREALFKAGRPGRRPWTWRVAKLPVGPDHVGSVAAPGLWRLRVVTDGPALPEGRP